VRPPDALREAVRAQALPREPDAEAVQVARGVAERGGEAVAAIVFFGSRKTKAGADPWSAFDMFVLTSEYRGFYRALRASHTLGRSPLLVAGLNTVLPPNQVSVPVPDGAGGEGHAKCAVVGLETLERETSPARRDHFCIGRLFQPAEIVFARDDRSRERTLDALASAHAETLSWVRPWLPPEFDVDAYTRTLLRVSLAREIRPEPEGRADALWQAQHVALRSVYSIFLSEALAAGELSARGEGVYALARPVTAGERLWTRFYFQRSLVRATVRWFKYIVTFEGWLDYIAKKAERHTGQKIELTPRERRLPLVFLWPRIFRYLRRKDGRA
jgi:hypothetical protein